MLNYEWKPSLYVRKVVIWSVNQVRTQAQTQRPTSRPDLISERNPLAFIPVRLKLLFTRSFLSLRVFMCCNLPFLWPENTSVPGGGRGRAGEGWILVASGLTAVNGLPLGHCYWDSFISISAPLSPQTMATNKTLTWKWVKCTWLVFSAGIVKQNKDGVKLLLDELWSPTAVVPQWILGSRCSRWHLNRKRTANESRPDDESKRGVSGTTENWKLRSFQVGGTVLWSERPHYSNSIQLVRFLLRKSFDTCCCYGCNKRLI